MVAAGRNQAHASALLSAILEAAAVHLQQQLTGSVPTLQRIMEARNALYD